MSTDPDDIPDEVPPVGYPMSTDPDDIPDEAPPIDGGEGTEVHDQPLGAPDDLDPEDAPLPGIPEAEPPSSG